MLEKQAAEYKKVLKSAEDQLAAHVQKEKRALAAAEAAQALSRRDKAAMQEERAQLAREVADSAARAACVEMRLADAQEALKAFRDFSALEKGRYKDQVRITYYKLLNRKVPSNQIEGVVRDVLKMVGIDPKRCVRLCELWYVSTYRTSPAPMYPNPLARFSQAVHAAS